jgi:hypothetical protein
MSAIDELRRVAATRYVTPLREGGSLPGLVEADDDGLYVAKFRGAGQGLRALVAEVIVGELIRSAGLLIPELVLLEIDPRLGAAEPDPEIQELISASTSCPARCPTPRPGTSNQRLSSPPRSSGSTRCARTSTAPHATRTCCAGTIGCG